MMFRKRSGASFFSSFFMPSDSTWKIAVVLASFRSGRRRVVQTERHQIEPFAGHPLMYCDASSIMVRLRRPRKSNLTRPAFFDVVLVELRHRRRIAPVA